MNKNNQTKELPTVIKIDPVTIEEIKLWQESTPYSYSDWDIDTISDCNDFLTDLIGRLENEL